MDLLILDPQKKFTDVTRRQLIDAIGILPHWLNSKDPRSVFDQFNANYKFGLYPTNHGSVDENGTFFYPGDPPLYPVAVRVFEKETVYFYLHALVTIVQNATKEHIMIRMD